MKIFYCQGMFVSRRDCNSDSYGAADELTEEWGTCGGGVWNKAERLLSAAAVNKTGGSAVFYQK
jgi:hypothetical protein